MTPGDPILFVPPPLQGAPAVRWLPGLVVAEDRSQGTVTIQCQVESSMDTVCTIAVGWTKACSREEYNRAVKAHNDHSFEEWIDGQRKEDT